jgi:hypothetical protein
MMLTKAIYGYTIVHLLVLVEYENVPSNTGKQSPAALPNPSAKNIMTFQTIRQPRL